MSQNSLSPHDPRFTAYALGELEPEEHAAVEAALRDNPAARAVVEEIRATAAQLSAALAAEPMAAATELPARAPAGAIGKGRQRSQPRGAPPPYEEKKVIKFPQFYYVVGLAAAACFALVVALREPTYHPTKQTVALPGSEKAYTTVEMAVPPTDGAAPAASPKSEEAGEAASKTVLAPPVTPLAPELRLADAGPVSDQKAVPLLEQIKIERSVSPPVAPPAGAAGIALSQATSPAPSRFAGGVPLSAPSEKSRELTVQVAPASSVPASSGQGVALSGYEVSVDKDAVNRMRGIPARPGAGANLAGGRMNTAVQEVPASIAVSEGVQLPPFQVSSGLEQGYASAHTLSGSRIPTALSPVERQGYVATDTLSGSRKMMRVESDSLRVPEVPRSYPGFGNTESYAHTAENDFLSAEQNPLSTFSADVDTASYTNVRRFIHSGRLPPADAVRIEEMVNYFPYAYPAPKDDQPFAASLEVASAPWAPTHRLVRIGLKAREVATKERSAANFVFLLDVSGSMNAPNRLPLVKESMRLLVGKLRRDDRVAIVTYAGTSGLALPSTPVAKSSEILEALDALSPGGSTNGAMGIQLAYDIAKANFVPGGINRVILCTDGDFNVGISSEGELARLIGEKAKTGVFLTVLGFGMGNLKDATLEKLADKGNGNYGYIDSRREAEKLLVEQVNGTLVTVAKDVKLQVDFNPAKVASYRLIGYENRLLKKEDFNNDQVDAGEIGAGHTVTALYEIIPVGAVEDAAGAVAAVEESKYVSRDASRAKVASAKGKAKAGAAAAGESEELLTVRVRYKKPDGILSRRLEFPLVDQGAAFATATNDFKFAAAVASFGMILRDSSHKGTATIADVLTWIGNDLSDDVGGHRSDFIDLVNASRRLMR